MPKKAKMSLEEARAFINKNIEKGGIVSLVKNYASDIKVISTGAFLVDDAMGVGGMPQGRIVELFGPPGSGKTTLMLSTVAQAQKQYPDKPVLYLDYEHAFDKEYAELLGVDTSEDRFLLGQPDSFENGMKIAELYIDNNIVSMIVFDSLAAMVTRKELDGEVDDIHVAILARAMTQALKRLTGRIHDSEVLVVFINHLKDVIATTYAARFGPKKNTPGGKALKFYSSVRLELRIAESIKGAQHNVIYDDIQKGVVAQKVRVDVVKNKVGVPFRIGFLYIWFGEGISESRAGLEVLLAQKVIKQSGSKFVVPATIAGKEDHTATGFPRLLKFINENEERKQRVIEAAIHFVKGGFEEDGEAVCDGDGEGSGGTEAEDVDLDAELGECGPESGRDSIKLR